MSKQYTEWGICGVMNSKHKNGRDTNGIVAVYALSFCLIGIVGIVVDLPVWIPLFLLTVLGLSFLTVIRIRLIRFIKDLEHGLDTIMDDGEFETDELLFEDDLYSKVMQKMWKIYSSKRETADSIEKEKKALQIIISDIAHQVKTPMTNVIVYQDILENSLRDREDCLETLATIRSQFEKLEFLLEAIIRLSELETGLIRLTREKTTLGECLKMALESAIIKADKKQIRIDIINKMNSEVYCDLKWTAEAVFNILDNAVKYSSRDGIISISSKEIGPYTCLIIRDNGIGIEKANMNNIFKRFYREKNGSGIEGLGLGLSLAREIIVKQNGYIMVDSEKGKWTEFSIFLPKPEPVSGPDEVLT